MLCLSKSLAFPAAKPVHRAWHKADAQEAGCARAYTTHMRPGLGLEPRHRSLQQQNQLYVCAKKIKTDPSWKPLIKAQTIVVFLKLAPPERQDFGCGSGCRAEWEHALLPKEARLAWPHGRSSSACQPFSPGRHLPCVQDAFILRQLPHKACVGTRDAALLLHVVICFFQRPAEFLHCIGYDCGSRATHAHFAMHQALGMVPPAGVEAVREEGWGRSSGEGVKKLQRLHFLRFYLNHFFKPCSYLPLKSSYILMFTEQMSTHPLKEIPPLQNQLAHNGISKEICSGLTMFCLQGELQHLAVFKDQVRIFSHGWHGQGDPGMRLGS